MSSTVANATSALDMIRDTSGPEYLPYFVNPNMLLGLGHQRCMSDTRLENPASADIEAFRKIRDKLNGAQQEYYCVVSEGRLVFDDTPYVMLELFSCRALSRLHEQPLMSLPALDDDSYESVESYLESLRVQASRERQRTAHQQPMYELRVHWLVGLLYGYPVPAVATMPPFWEYDYKGDEYRRRVYEAEIEHADEYFEASAGMCIYDFPWFMVEHPDIVDHQQSWSEYFRTFYNSDWHRQAAEDENFQATLVSVRDYENKAVGEVGT